jgi:molybdate transport system substrate-binding protein
VRVAAAADLQFALKDVVAEFERAHPNIHVDTTIGASGNLYSQLANQAPFDVFLSADRQYPQKLIQAGRADGSTEFRYAVGQLVVWVQHSSPLDVEHLGIKALLEPSVKKIAIANPKHAPYGRAAEAALKSLGVYDRVKDRLVFGENVAQTAQFVESGAAEAGVIAHSLALAPAMKDRGKSWNVPLSSYPKLEQAGVVLTASKNRDAALEFCRFLQSQGGRTILGRYGFVRPDE